MIPQAQFIEKAVIMAYCSRTVAANEKNVSGGISQAECVVKEGIRSSETIGGAARFTDHTAVCEKVLRE